MNQQVNVIESAKNKLVKHREMGEKSPLNIMEVAALMDVVTYGVVANSIQQSFVEVKYSLN
jgi:hypothetical protein